MTQSLEISPRPKVGVENAAILALELFGIQGSISELSSHQDRNFRIVTNDDDVVLKIANKSWRRGALEAQNDALLYLANQDTSFHAPIPRTGLDGN